MIFNFLFPLPSVSSYGLFVFLPQDILLFLISPWFFWKWSCRLRLSSTHTSSLYRSGRTRKRRETNTRKTKKNRESFYFILFIYSYMFPPETLFTPVLKFERKGKFFFLLSPSCKLILYISSTWADVKIQTFLVVCCVCTHPNTHKNTYSLELCANIIFIIHVPLTTLSSLRWETQNKRILSVTIKSTTRNGVPST